MREAFVIIYIFLILALVVSSLYAKRSNRAIGRALAFFLAAIVPPVFGNMMIIGTENRTLAILGHYIFFLGMDVGSFALIRFAFKYCKAEAPAGMRYAVRALLILDVVQYALNPFFEHAFTVEETAAYGKVYYKLVPFWGQTYHRIIDYGIFFVVILLMLIMVIRTPRIYKERYSVILIALIICGVWQAFYIFSKSPLDRSMIAFAICGMIVFYFAIFYRPLRLLDRMLAGVVSEMPEAMFFFDAEGNCVWANTKGHDLAKVENEEYENVLTELELLFGDLRITDPDWSSKKVIDTGEDFRYYTLEKHTRFNANEKPEAYYLTIRDTTEEQLALKRDLYNAAHDKLTGLYTREYMYQEIQKMVKQNYATEYLVIFVDVNEFKIVNDIFGTEFGDYAIKCVAELIRSYMDRSCVYGRLAGDTFGILVPKGLFHQDKMEARLAGFVVNDGTREHHILIHLGVYEVQDRDMDVSVMFDRAHLALSTIKGDYQRHIAIYDDEMRKKVLWDQHISNQLHEAIEQKQIQPYLQPIMNPDGKVIGAEALVRWVHPVDGFLSPGAFIPVFEKNGMIAEVDKYMWRSAAELLAKWGEKRKDLFISVNISPKDFYFMNVKEEIMAIVKEYGIDPRRLRLEITETVMMTDIENRIKMIDELREAGFIVEMDDFGSGYSSLNLLKDMPVDVIKIDMMFLRKSGNNPRAEIIIHNIIELTEDLKIVSLTEGVETEEQYRMLADMGCNMFQGYYFARPMQIEGFEAFCDTHG